jgi:lysophospholipase L1-like esterase
MRRAVEAALAALLLGLSVAGCAHAPRGSAPLMRYLALGDSYTIGEGAYPQERWPNQLAAKLRERGFNVPDPKIVAKTGWTTDELAQGIADQVHHPPTYALVTLLIGVNNQYRGRDIDEYRRQLVSLLTQSIGFAGGDASRVIVVSIPDWGVTPYAHGRDAAKIASDIDRFNAVNREEAARAGARYADVTALSRLHGADPDYLMRDGLHPSARAYTEWVEVVLPEAEAALHPKEKVSE